MVMGHGWVMQGPCGDRREKPSCRVPHCALITLRISEMEGSLNDASWQLLAATASILSALDTPDRRLHEPASCRRATPRRPRLGHRGQTGRPICANLADRARIDRQKPPISNRTRTRTRSFKMRSSCNSRRPRIPSRAVRPFATVPRRRGPVLSDDGL